MERHGASHRITATKTGEDPNNMVQVKSRPMPSNQGVIRERTDAEQEQE